VKGKQGMQIEVDDDDGVIGSLPSLMAQHNQQMEQWNSLQEWQVQLQVKSLLLQQAECTGEDKIALMRELNEMSRNPPKRPPLPRQVWGKNASGQPSSQGSHHHNPRSFPPSISRSHFPIFSSWFV